jgi:hypothetical protein
MNGQDVSSIMWAQAILNHDPGPLTSGQGTTPQKKLSFFYKKNSQPRKTILRLPPAAGVTFASGGWGYPSGLRGVSLLASFVAPEHRDDTHFGTASSFHKHQFMALLLSLSIDHPV